MRSAMILIASLASIKGEIPCAISSSSEASGFLSFANEENLCVFNAYIDPGYKPTDRTTAIVNTVQFYGQSTLYVTTAYNGTVASQPGRQSSVCQWTTINAGSAATVALSLLPGVGNEGGCGSAGWPQPLNVTFGWMSTPGTPGAAATIGTGLMTDLSFYPQYSTNAFLKPNTLPAVVDAQVVAALSAASGAAEGGLLFCAHRGFMDPTRRDSTLITIAPQLADGDVLVLVQPMVIVGGVPVEVPRCLPTSRWPSPSQPNCSHWTWAFSTAAGGGALYIDGSNSCAPPTLTGGGAPPLFNPGNGDIKTCEGYSLFDHLWVLVVPLAAPAVAALPAVGSARAGALQSFPQLRTIHASSDTPGEAPSEPLFVPDGSTVRSVTVPFTQCPIRSPSNGSCLYAATTPWNVTSAATYFLSTFCGGRAYPAAASDNVVIEVSRLCFEDTAGLSGGSAAESPVPRPGVCRGGGPPLTLYLRADEVSDFLPHDGTALWADAYSASWTLTMAPNASTLRLAVPPSLCAGIAPSSTCTRASACGLELTVSPNCAAPGGPWAGCTAPRGVDGSLRLLHSVSMRSSLSVRSIGADCLGLGAACSLAELGGAVSPGAAYRFALPSADAKSLPPLLIWAQLPSSAGPATLFLCQEPLGGPASRCTPGPFSPPLESADAVIPIENGTARVLISNPDITGSGRPYFRVFLALPAGNAAVIVQPPPPGFDGLPYGFDLMLAGGVTFTLLLAAGPTWVFVAPQVPPTVSASNASAAVATFSAAAGAALSTDGSFPAPTQSLIGWELQAWLLRPEWYHANVTALSTAPGIRATVEMARQRGITVPSASAPGGSLNGPPVSVVFSGLIEYETYILVAIGRCANNTGCSLPYLSAPQEVAFSSVTFVMPPPGGGGGGRGAGAGKLSTGAIAGIVSGILVVTAAAIGAVVRCLRRRQWQARSSTTASGFSASGGAALAGIDMFDYTNASSLDEKLALN